MNHSEKAKELVNQMTLVEKASLCSGKNFWYLKGIERLGLNEIMVTDGPHGLRKQETAADNLGINQSVPAVCFPTASATACSFDRQLIYEVGKAIAEECRQENVAVLLGPGMNIKRSPLCGRNFEYFSEDPLLSGEMAAGFIEGVQSQNVGVSVKHFAVNNQEKRRMVSESVLDERTFRELYLKGFEIAIKKAKPWTVMCSYNKLFGEFASQNEYLLTKILRNDWEFEGLVVTDWGAVVNRVKGLQAGLDLEMPNVGVASENQIIEAVKEGSLKMEKLDETAKRITELILRASDRLPYQYDPVEHHTLARRAAAESAVLLKNENQILPIKTNTNAAVIGAFAKNPRYQGTGSSKIIPIKIDSAFDELVAAGITAEYAEGYRMDTDLIDEALVQQACKTAEGKEVVFLFAGLPDIYESEGFDREKMSMPENHIKLIEEVSKVNPHVVVILMGGSPMEIPWIHQVQGVLLMYLGGEACGGACADLLIGKVNPSGKLAETWPIQLSDTPSNKYFPGYPLTVEYREGLFVGYRYFDTAHKPVRYPFGYGLSYTQFEYSDLKCSADLLTENSFISISFKVKNVGSSAGREIVQLYLAKNDSVIIRPEQELKNFNKINLEPGESKEVQFTLKSEDLGYFNVEQSCWQVESGKYEVRVGSSSREIHLSAFIDVQGKANQVLPDFRNKLPSYYNIENGIDITDQEFETLLGRPIPPVERKKGAPHSINSTVSDIQDKWLGRILVGYMRKEISKMGQDNPDMKEMAEKMLLDMPLRSLTLMASGGEGGGFSILQIQGLVELLNGHLFRGIRLFLKK